jgi:HipA-like protein
MTIEAIEYRQELLTGSTKPVVLQCESPNGETSDYVVKLKSSSKTGVFGLASEWICSGLAENLNLAAPRTAVVVIGREFAEAVPNESVRARLLANLGANFGSQYLTGGYTAWLKHKPLTRPLRQLATEILCFDVFVQNLDRRPEKPNLLWKGDEFVIVDHELAFPFPFAIGDPEPWSDTFATGIRGHLFFPGLKGNLDSLERFRGAIESLTNEVLEAAFEGIPAEWCPDNKVDSVRQYLPRRRDSAEVWFESIRRELA